MANLAIANRVLALCGGTEAHGTTEARMALAQTSPASFLAAVGQLLGVSHASPAQPRHLLPQCAVRR
eukprot:12456225-Alexandrium_andersonii.AAC.1